ncbi:MAG: universal stress protein [Psychroflexus sp.]
MKTIHNILLLTDFSEVSESAAVYALEIGKKINSRVEILHLINTPVEWSKLPLEKEKLYPETKAEIGNAKAKLSALSIDFSKQGVKTKESLIFNVGVENIPEHINADNYDLIIMGSHGSKGIKESVIGSNAQKILRRIKIPILVVKTPFSSDAFSRIVMASTFEKNQKPFFKQMLNFATDLEVGIDLLYINTPYNFRETQQIQQMLSSFCEECTENDCGKHHVDAFNEESGIQYFMENSEAGLFAIATSEKSQLSRLFSPSLSEAVINHLDIPVLVFHLETGSR